MRRVEREKERRNMADKFFTDDEFQEACRKRSSSLTPAQREYDRRALSGTLRNEDDRLDQADRDESCSCHLSAPCGFCLTNPSNN